ncbi:MAG: oxygenase MpaB family protein, partial [Actinomycetota bacterium]|nr:oxygenase MpaB family protein [Actinomycetota bacterium]
MAAGLFPTESELDQLILGPDSVAWRIASDVRLNMVMLYPLLLQVAHPTVSAGVVDFEQRPWERLVRTLDYVNVLIYGGREAAAAGRRLRTLHRRFKGVRE